MKRFGAILFGLLLVWAQLLAAPALPACARQPAHGCCHCGGKMNCCSAPMSGSQSAPAVPAPSGIQNQFSFLAPAVMAWALPENAAGSISSAFVLSLTASSAPLYARDCARLI
ncbi:MAG: hypothetical protein ABSF60_04565 [Verrucomicrobiota bacterium]